LRRAIVTVWAWVPGCPGTAFAIWSQRREAALTGSGPPRMIVRAGSPGQSGHRLATIGDMTVLREELHRIVDLLPEDEVGTILTYVRDHATVTEPAGEESWPLPEFVGMVSIDDPSWSAGSEDFLRERLGRAGQDR
jgi:hypothetical protein